MKGGKGGRKRPADAPPDPARAAKGPSRGVSKKDWGAIERAGDDVPKLPEPPEKRRKP